VRASRRRLLFGLLAGLAIVAGLAALGWFPQEPLRRLVEARLQQALGPGARVGALRVWPGRLYAELDGLVVETPAYSLTARHVRVSLRRATLEGHAISLRSLAAEGVRLHVRGDAPETPASGAELLPIVIEDLSVTDAQLLVSLPAASGALHLDGVTLQGGVGLGALTAKATGGRWEGAHAVPLGPVAARVRLTPALDIEVEAFEAGLQRSRLTASGPLGRVGRLQPDVAWSARIDLAELAAPLELGDLEGTVQAQGAFRLPASGPEVTADVTAEALRHGPWAADSARGHVSHEAGLTTAAIDARLLGGTARLDATGSPSSLKGRMVATALDAAQVFRGAGVAGRVSADLTVTGDPSRALAVDGRVAADARHGSTPFRVEVRLDGPVATDGSSVALDWAGNAQAAEGGSALRLEASGRAHGAWPPTIDAHLEGTLATSRTGALPLEAQVRSHGDAFELDGSLMGLGQSVSVRVDAVGTRVRALTIEAPAIGLDRLAPGLAGQARLHVDASGALDALTGQASLQLEDAAWRGALLGPATLEATSRAGVAEVALRAPDWNLEGHGTIDRARLLRARVDLRETPLAGLSVLLPPGPPLAGALTASVDLELPLARPADGSARAEIGSLDAARGGLRVRNQGPARLSWSRSGVLVERLALRGDGFDADVAGRVALAPLALDLRVAGATELDALPVPEGWTLAGRISVDAQVAGTPARPSATGQVTFDDAGLALAGFPPLAVPEGRIDLAGDALVLPDLALAVAGGRVVLAGRIPLAAALPAARARADRVAPGESADVRVAWEGVRADEWPQGGEATLAGTLDGTLALSGGLASLAEVRARLDVPATTLRVEEILVQVQPFALRLQAGQLRGDVVRIAAAESTLQLEGGADLLRRRLDLTALGALNLRALSPFMEAAALSGTAELDVSARGAWSAPDVHGTVTVEDASLRLRTLPQALTSLRAQVVFDGQALRVPRATAVMGGGDLTLSGSGRLAGGLADAQFTLTGRDVTLAYPPGLRSRLDADLTLSGGPRAYLLAGDVRAVRGLYDLDLVFEQSLSTPPAPATDSPALRRFGLDLRVEIQNAVQVRNNMTDLQAVGALTVRGDMNAPAPLGTLEIEPGGRVYLGGRAFEIASGALNYRGNWDPTLQIEATDLITGTDTDGLASDYEVTVRLVGSLERPGLQMSSDPPLSEGQIVSLIATGRTDGGSAALRLAVGGQAAMLLAGRLTRRLRDLGLDEVSIQPELVAREGQNETGARFTFAKRLSSRLELVYSLSLQDPEARFILLEARPGHDVVLRGQRSDAGTVTGSVGQRFQFGGPPRKRPASVDRRVRLTGLRFEGAGGLPEAELARLAGVKVGQRRTVWDLQDDADRLRERLMEQGYLEAEAGVRLDEGVAVFRVRSGARYDWRVEGTSAPPDLRRVIRGALFEEEALDLGRRAVLAALHERGHLRARVAARAQAGPDQVRTLVFTAEPGPRYQPVEVEFPGAHELSRGALLQAAGGLGRLVASPGEAVRDIQDAYHRAFHLAARVEPPRIEEAPPSGLRIRVTVHEGPRARVGAVRFEGATRDAAELARAAGLRSGAPYDPEAALAATDRLRERYFRWGYGNVRVQAAGVPAGPDVDVVFSIEEGRRAVLGQVVVQGLRRTKEALVRRQLRLRPGAPLDPRRLASLERRLLDMGLFSRVVTSVSGDDPATLTITLEEDDRYFGRYALSYEQKRTVPGQESPNVLERSTTEVDAEVRNLLGWGARAGARARVGADVRDASTSLDVPSLPVVGKLTATVFRIQQDTAIEPGPSGERRESQGTQNGFEVSFSRRLPGRTDLLYGYRLEDSEVVSPDFIEPQTARTAVLRASAIRDTRDSVLDARRGRFLSLSVDYAPAFLRADFTFVKGAAQAFLARPLGTAFTWAHAYRLGLGTGLGGQNIRSTERFRAGGANSIRGFETDGVGPFDSLTSTFSGGEALMVVNQEIRYRHPSGFGGALFYDGGNVFAKAKDFSFDWRHVLGAGLRWDSPIGLLRVDLGVPLSRRVLPYPEPVREPAYQLFFSLGQAF
jgi:outer membrane protein insertion porin family